MNNEIYEHRKKRFFFPRKERSKAVKKAESKILAASREQAPKALHDALTKIMFGNFPSMTPTKYIFDYECPHVSVARFDAIEPFKKWFAEKVGRYLDAPRETIDSILMKFLITQLFYESHGGDAAVPCQAWSFLGIYQDLKIRGLEEEKIEEITSELDSRLKALSTPIHGTRPCSHDHTSTQWYPENTSFLSAFPPPADGSGNPQWPNLGPKPQCSYEINASSIQHGATTYNWHGSIVTVPNKIQTRYFDKMNIESKDKPDENTLKLSLFSAFETYATLNCPHIWPQIPKDVEICLKNEFRTVRMWLCQGWASRYHTAFPFLGNDLAATPRMPFMPTLKGGTIVIPPKIPEIQVAVIDMILARLEEEKEGAHVLIFLAGTDSNGPAVSLARQSEYFDRIPLESHKHFWATVRPDKAYTNLSPKTIPEIGETTYMADYHSRIVILKNAKSHFRLEEKTFKALMRAYETIGKTCGQGR